MGSTYLICYPLLDDATCLEKSNPSPKYTKFSGGKLTDFSEDKYPIMTRKHEMVSSITSIPIFIFVGYDVHIITDSSLQYGLVTNNWVEEVLKDHHNTKGQKIDMGFIWILSPKLRIDFQ